MLLPIFRECILSNLRIANDDPDDSNPRTKEYNDVRNRLLRKNSKELETMIACQTSAFEGESDPNSPKILTDDKEFVSDILNFQEQFQSKDKVRPRCAPLRVSHACASFLDEWRTFGISGPPGAAGECRLSSRGHRPGSGGGAPAVHAHHPSMDP